MSMAAQAKVLRVLQDNVITRIGGSKPITVDVRVLAATNKNLEQEIAAGRFREDLFYRLNVVPIHVPPLREHREDIPELVEYFVSLLSEREGFTPRRVSESAMARLMELDWPGNVRELRNTVERMLILATGPEMTREGCRSAGRRARGRRHRTRRPDGHQDIRGVQGSRRAGVSSQQAARVRLECLRDRSRGRDAALESLQENRALRAHARTHITTHHPMKQFNNFIAGAWVPPDSGEYFENRNPADRNDLIGAFPLSSAHRTCERAVASAKRGFARVANYAGARARRRPAHRRRSPVEAEGRDRRRDDARDGKAAHRNARRRSGRHRYGVLRRERRTPPVRAHGAERAAQQVGDELSPADRRGRADLPVQFPARDSHLENVSRAGLRKRGDLQAGRGRSAHRRRCWSRSCSRPACRRK